MTKKAPSSQSGRNSLLWTYTCGSCGSRIATSFAFLGIVFLIAALVLPPVIHEQILKGVYEDIIIDSVHASGYSSWADTTQPDVQPTYFQIYFFDVINPLQILQGAKPIVVQKGPYSYREYSIRFDVTWSDQQDHVSFKTQTYYVFDPSTSGQGLSESDMITNVDLALAAVRYQIMMGEGSDDTKLLTLRGLMCEGLGQPSPFHTRSVKDLFWGYDNDPILVAVAESGQTIATSFPALQPNDSSIELARNTSNVDIIHTGKHDRSQLFRYIKYQNMSVMHSCTSPPPGQLECPLYQAEWTEQQASANGWSVTWNTDQAGAIVGTDATQFPRPASSRDLLVYVDALSRSANLTNSNSEEVKDLYEISLKRYRLRPQDLLNATQNLDNAAYNMYGPQGVLNFTSVVGFPFFVTKPHFLDCDPRLAQSFEGLSPTRDLHDTIVDVEEYSGITMRASKRLQFNSQLNWILLTPTPSPSPSASASPSPSVSASAHNETSTPTPTPTPTSVSVSPSPSASPSNATKLETKDESKIDNKGEKQVDPDECFNLPSSVWQWNYTTLTPEHGFFIPYAWVDENEQLTSKQASDFKNGVYKNRALAHALYVWLMAAFGTCIAISALVSVAHWLGRREESKSRARTEELGEGLMPGADTA